MIRVRREEPLSEEGMRVIGYWGDDGAAVSDVDDRFNAWLKLENPETGKTSPGRPLAQTGIDNLAMTEVMVLGFTTEEYKWMLRFELEGAPGDFVSSEYELNALVAGRTPSKMAGVRLAYEQAPNGPVTQDQFRNGPNHRTRGADQNWPHHALGWVDYKGNRIRHVPDRMQAQYLYDGYFGGRQIMGPISENGVRGMDLTSLVVLGFSADEYRAMYAYEEETGLFVESEDQLDEIMGYSRDRGLRPPSR